MMPNEGREKKRRSWKLRLLFWVGIPIAALLIIALLFDANGRARLNRAMREARELGEPVTFDEIMAARKEWPEAENGANIILSLKDRLDAIPKEEVEKLPIIGDVDLPPLGQRWTEETDQIVATQLERLSTVLANIDKLKDYVGGRFPLEIADNPIRTLLPYLGLVRMSVRLKSLQTIYRSMHDDTESLVDDITIMTKHGQLLQDEPTLISALVWIACDSLAVETIKDVCAQTELSSQQLIQLEQLLASMENQERMYWGILGERASFIGAGKYMRNTGDFSEIGGAPPFLPKLPGLRGLLMQDQAAGIKLHNRLVSSAKDSKAAAEAARQIDKESASLPFYYVITRTLFPSLERAFERDLEYTALLRSARTALAAERYRIDKHEFPAKLDQLVPDYLDQIPADPFDEQPLRYLVNDEGVIVYSIGMNKVDDGGDVSRERKRNQQYLDCGFILLSPESRGQPPAAATSESSDD